MNNDKKVVSVGTISIFLVLIVLLFLTFSLLSLALSSSDLKLSEKALCASTDYYDADYLAENLIYNSIVLAEDEGLEAAARDINDSNILCSVNESTMLLSFDVEVNDKLRLYVETEILFENGRAQNINTIRWQCAENEIKE